MKFVLLIFIFSLTNPGDAPGALAHKYGYNSQVECQQAYVNLEAERPGKDTMGTKGFCVSENDLLPLY